MNDDIPKIKCFVALFDILGFGELVKKSNLEEVFKTYNDIKKFLSEMQDKLRRLVEAKPPKIHNFSDTFLIYTPDIRSQNIKVIDKTFDALLVMCDSLFLSANKNKLPIRGTITVGELIVSKGIEIGIPIVDAYEKEKKQEWIGCLIDKKCIEQISEKALERHLKYNSIVKYKIPFKNGKIEQFYAFNWVRAILLNKMKFFFLEKKEWHDWATEMKHENTWKFIDFIKTNKKFYQL